MHRFRLPRRSLLAVAAARVVADDDVPLTHHLRAYLVYAMCSAPALVDNAPEIINSFSRLPGLALLTNTFIRLTFFNQFVGGDTASETIPVLRSLRQQNKGALLVYSVEADHTEGRDAHHDQFVDEIMRSIDVAADFEHQASGNDIAARKTWVALKFSALLPDAQALHNLSDYITRLRALASDAIPFPGTPHHSDLAVFRHDADEHHTPAAVPAPLSDADVASLRALYVNLERICAHAQMRGVRIIVDAEYSWYQPAIDALTLALMRRFNKAPEDGDVAHTVQPLVYGTYQAYLRRTPLHLANALQDARTHGYALGIKLVRGAYHPQELSAHRAARLLESRAYTKTTSAIQAPPSISLYSDPPVWERKAETDACFNACARVLVHAVRDDIYGPGNGRACSMKNVPKEKGESRATFTQRISSFFPLPASGPSTSSVGLSSTARARVPPRIGVLFGTHNWESCELILDEMNACGLSTRREIPVQRTTDCADREEEKLAETVPALVIADEAVERIAIAQLYGMSDDLTAHLASCTSASSPLAMKYVPYGPLIHVMPYLARRAVENKTMLGGGSAVRERQRAWNAFWTRLVG